MNDRKEDSTAVPAGERSAKKKTGAVTEQQTAVKLPQRLTKKQHKAMKKEQRAARKDVWRTVTPPRNMKMKPDTAKKKAYAANIRPYNVLPARIHEMENTTRMQEVQTAANIRRSSAGAGSSHQQAGDYKRHKEHP